MATGEVVGIILGASPPTTVAAVPDTITGGSTPAEYVPVLDYDGTASTTTHYDFVVQLEGYDGGGLTVKLRWSASSATSGDTVWQVAVRRIADDAEDVDTTAHTYVYNTVTATAPSAAGEVSYDNVTFTDGADMDSWADGEIAVVRVKRDTDHASDNMTGDAELWMVPIVTET